MDLQRLASTLLGKKRAETNTVMTDATTRTYVGTATSASEDGSVYVELSEDVTLPDDDDGTHGLGVEMPTTVNVDEGDEVIVTVFGGGTMKAPVVTGNPGWGDRVQTQVDSAETLAEQAEAVATATGQHFWPDDNGVHVTEVTQEDWNDAESPDYHSGANVLLNALGQLFRDGMSNLLVLLPGQSMSDSFVIVDDPQATEIPSYTLSATPASFPTIKVNGEVEDPDQFILNGDVLTFSGDTPYWLWDGQTMEVIYRTSPAMVLYDGEGNTGENIVASFEQGKVSLAKKANPDAEESGEIEFFNGDASLKVRHTGEQTLVHLSSADNQLPEYASGGILFSPGSFSAYASSSEDDSGAIYGDGRAEIDLASGSLGSGVSVSAQTLELHPGYGKVGGEWSMQSIITLLDSLFDTWHVGTFASPFSNYDGLAQNAPRWRKFGNVVEFHGIATVTSQQAAGNRKLFTLPDGYRPTGITRYAGIMQGSNMNRFLLRVNTGGEVYMERYGTTSDSAIPANAWLTLTGLFMI